MKNKKNKISINVDIDNWTTKYQLSINDENGGYRINGPKFNGSSKNVLTAEIDYDTAKEIMRYLQPVIEAHEKKNKKSLDI